MIFFIFFLGSMLMSQTGFGMKGSSNHQKKAVSKSLNFLQEKTVQDISGEPLDATTITLGALSHKGAFAACAQLAVYVDRGEGDDSERDIEQILLIDMHSGRVLYALDRFFNEPYENRIIKSIQFSFDDQFIVAYSETTILVWQWDETIDRYTFYDSFIMPEESGVITTVALSRNGGLMAIGDSSGSMRVFCRGLLGDGTIFFLKDNEQISLIDRLKGRFYKKYESYSDGIEKIWFLSDDVVYIRLSNRNRDIFQVNISGKKSLKNMPGTGFINIKNIQAAVAESYKDFFPAPETGIEARVQSRRFSQLDSNGLQIVLSSIYFYQGPTYLAGYCEVGLYKVLQDKTIEKIAVLEGDLTGSASDLQYFNDYANHSIITLKNNQRETMRVCDGQGSFCGMIMLGAEFGRISDPVFRDGHLSCIVRTPDNQIKFMQWSLVTVASNLFDSLRGRELNGCWQHGRLQIPPPAKSIQDLHIPDLALALEYF